jgi:uncharacterized protein
MDDSYCLDTYAIVEIFYGNPKFSKFILENYVIPDWVLGEFYYVWMQKYDEAEADSIVKKIESHSMSVSKEIIIKSMKFRYQHKKDNPGSNLSFFDAIGYIFSRENNYIFVTGDKEFVDLEGVEYVKK